MGRETSPVGLIARLSHVAFRTRLVVITGVNSGLSRDRFRPGRKQALKVRHRARRRSADTTARRVLFGRELILRPHDSA
jgi:hypothetical protein